MNDGFEVRIVKVKGVRTDPVDQCCTAHVDLDVAPQHAGLGGRLQQGNGGKRRVCGIVRRCAYRTAKPVGESPVGFVVHQIAPATRRVTRDELRQDLRDGRGIVVSGDLCIAGHVQFSS